MMTKKITTELLSPSDNTKNIVQKSEKKSLSLFDQLLKEAKKDISKIQNTKKDIINNKSVASKEKTNTLISLGDKQKNTSKKINKNAIRNLEQKMNTNKILNKTNEKQEKVITNLKSEDVKKSTKLDTNTKITEQKTNYSLDKLILQSKLENKKNTNVLTQIKIIKNIDLEQNKIVDTNLLDKKIPTLNKQENIKKEHDLDKNEKIKNINLSKNKIVGTILSNKKMPSRDKQEHIKKETLLKNTTTIEKVNIKQKDVLKNTSTNKVLNTKENKDTQKTKDKHINAKKINTTLTNELVYNKQDTKANTKEEVIFSKKEKVSIKSKDIKQKTNLLNQNNTLLNKKNLESSILEKTSKETPLTHKEIRTEIKTERISEENVIKISLTKDDTISTKNQDLVQTPSSNSNTVQIVTSSSLGEKLNLYTTKNHKQVKNDHTNKEEKNTTITTKNIASFDELQKEDISINKININKKDVLSKIYLSTQNNSINNQVLQNKNTKDKLVKNITSKSDIKESAKIMNLNLQDIKVDIKIYEHKQNLQKNLLNKIALNQNILKKQTQENINNTNENIKITNNKNNYIDSEKVINLNIAPSLALSIQSKIIGAKQGVSSMMSELAKKMYANYKAPLTSFRINLFPSQMGSIAIIMKNDKDSGISISMNMSNTNTLDAFIENQQSLKDSLNKTFNNNTSFSLDFDMNKENSSNTSDNKHQKEKETLSNEVLSSTNIIDDELDTLNYM